MAEKKSRRETWEAWQDRQAPPPRLVTREETLALLAELGLRVTERDLRFWEARGVLPRPVRRWYEGATRAVYPRWIVGLVLQLRYWQQEGLQLAELPGPLRLKAEELSLDLNGRPLRPRPVGVPYILQQSREALRAQVWSLMDQYRRQIGVEVIEATLVLTDTHGRKHEYPLDVPTDGLHTVSARGAERQATE